MPKIRMERTPHSLITEGVDEREQTLGAGKPFWVMFTANLGIGTWLMGVLLAAAGLSFTDAMFVLLVGSVIGSLLPAMLATLGPPTRLSQMEMARFSLGRVGKRLPAFLNWVGTVGWDVVNNLLSAAAFVALLSHFGVHTQLWVGLTLLATIQMIVGVYGHHMIQDTSKYVGILLGLFFFVVGIIALRDAGSLPAPSSTPTSIKDVLGALLLIISYNTSSWSTYTADYTRYLPKNTSSRTVFTALFMALFLSLFVLAFFGYMTAGSVVEQTPAGVMDALEKLTGHFAPLMFALVAFSAIPANAVNDNSAAYSLISAGLKVSRPVSAIFGAGLSYVIALMASSAFMELFENLLYLFFQWVAPWAAVMLVHWFVVGRKEQITPSGFTRGAAIFIGVTLTSIALFSANSLYTGFLSDAVGGIDIGPILGFIASGVGYYFSLRLWPVRTKKINASVH